MYTYVTPESGEKRHLRRLAHVQNSNVASMPRKRLVADFFGVLENAHVVHDPLTSDLPRIHSQPTDHGKGVPRVVRPVRGRKSHDVGSGEF